jgi:hypothetical protein
MNTATATTAAPFPLESSIPLPEFNQKYTVVRNRANGDCLFESLCFALPLATPECVGLKPKMLRKNLAESYGQLLALPDFAPENDAELENTLLNEIKLGIRFDNDDGLKKHHEEITKDRVWASMTDVLLLGYMTQVDIYLIEPGEDCVHVNNMTKHANPRGFVMLYYSNQEHFEAVVPQMPEDYSKFCVFELKQLCKERNIEGAGRMKKAELVAALSSTTVA